MEQAIRHIGYEPATPAYSYHKIMVWVSRILPESVHIRIAYSFGKKIRASAKRKEEKEKSQ